VVTMVWVVSRLKAPLGISSYIIYTIICTHTELLDDIDNTVVISCCCLMFKPYLKKVFSGKKTGTLCS